MWFNIPFQFTLDQAHANSYWRKTICLQHMRAKVCREVHNYRHNISSIYFVLTQYSLHFCSYNLRKHHEIHKRDTQNEPLKNYKCLVCPQTFISREKLNKHLVQAHQAIETSIPLNGFYVA